MEQQYLEHVTLPMYPVHKAHRAKRDAGCALTFFSERPQSRFRVQKSPKGTSTSSGLKRLKTQNTPSEKRKGDALKGIPKSIHKRELILDEEEFDASSSGGGGGNRTPVQKPFHIRCLQFILLNQFKYVTINKQSFAYRFLIDFHEYSQNILYPLSYRLCYRL